MKVYILLEHHQRHLIPGHGSKEDYYLDTDASILGAYSDLECASKAKYRYARNNRKHGYLAIITKRVKGTIILNPETTSIDIQFIPRASTPNVGSVG